MLPQYSKYSLAILFIAQLLQMEKELQKWIVDLLLENQRFMDLTSIHLSDLAEIIADKGM
jgi:hypothetical protein